MATNVESFVSVTLTDFHDHPGTLVDQSQQSLVVLTKHKRRYAAVVSIDFLERANAALGAQHANRRVLGRRLISSQPQAH